jgi:hypothetical protein
MATKAQQAAKKKAAARRAAAARKATARSNNNNTTPWIIGAIVALLLGWMAFNYLANRPAATSSPQTVVQTQIVYQTQVVFSTPVPAAPAQPATNPGPVVSSSLTISEFARMWSSHLSSEGPGSLMEELNSYFDSGGYQFGGQFSGKDGWDIPAGSVVWTDLLDQSNQVFYVGTTNPVNTTNDFVRLRCQGNWCVFYTYAAVRLPTPGRFLSTDRWLNPAADLSGW